MKSRARADTRADRAAKEQQKSNRREAREQRKSRERLELKSTSVGSAVGSESCRRAFEEHFGRVGPKSRTRAAEDRDRANEQRRPNPTKDALMRKRKENKQNNIRKVTEMTKKGSRRAEQEQTFQKEQSEKRTKNRARAGK